MKAEEEKQKRLEFQREQQRLRQAREDAYGFGGPFGMGSPFGMGGPFGGPKIRVRFGPSGVTFVFMDDYGFEKDEYFNFESGYDSDDRFEDDGLSREEHCAILGVDVDATSREIKTAYRRMALKYHPDKFNEESSDAGMSKAEAEEHFKKCSSAYQALSEEFQDE